MTHWYQYPLTLGSVHARTAQAGGASGTAAPPPRFMPATIATATPTPMTASPIENTFASGISGGR